MKEVKDEASPTSEEDLSSDECCSVGPSGPSAAPHGSALKARAPTPRPSNRRVRISQTPDCRSPRTATAAATSQEQASDVDSRIPKPKGEVGHPGTHSYSLFSTLKWEEAVYNVQETSS
ncbi:hypothetical protein M422DRAFT_266008 [Sphaerobolus stellatus SS14]|uniref:Uncharacterized protein n=1 Tax=Sphaerobolus stellatus (strain SS14) TaxID=990650 RepID=A0A0C9UC20_SPHS4|nr:hypothetical protein M422DRAFT_266008 [Sphaerobolus stellatus SS14]